jgi:hypothetical protein
VLVCGGARAQEVAPAPAPGPSAGVAPARDPAAAREELKEGYALRQEARWAEAIPHLVESVRLDPQAKALLNLADCEEHVGRFVDAEQHWVSARDLAEGPSAASVRDEASRRLAALTMRMPRLTVLLAPGAPADAQVSRDGAVLAPGSLGLALSADPGRHVVEVASRGRRPGRVEVVLSEGEAATVQVEPGAPLVPEPTAPSPPLPPSSLPVRMPDAGDLPATPASAPSPLPALAWTAAILGAGGLTLGVVEGLRAESQHDNAVAACHGKCTASPEAQSLQADARSSASLSTAGFIGGGVLAASSVVLFLLPPHRAARSHARWQWAPFAGPRGGGVAAATTF